MKFYVKNMTDHGTRFFVLQNLENPGFGFKTFESYGINPVSATGVELKLKPLEPA
jgi:hypothetical protein